MRLVLTLVMMAVGANIGSLVVALGPTTAQPVVSALEPLRAIVVEDESDNDEWTDETMQEMGNYRKWVEKWAQSMNLSMPEFTYASVGTTQCGQPIERTEAFFCRKEDRVYMTVRGIRQWAELHKLGGYVTTSHEVAHHFQYLANPDAKLAPAFEQQAYCGSGVFVKWATENVPDIAKYDVQQWEGVFLGNGASDASHGPVLDWVTAFDLGYRTGDLAACTELYPEVVLAAAP